MLLALNGLGRAVGGEHRAGARRSGRLLFQQGPIKSVIVLVVKGTEQYTEQLTKIHIVRRFFKPQPSAIIQIHCKLSRKSLRERRRGREGGEREGRREGEERERSQYYQGFTHETTNTRQTTHI